LAAVLGALAGALATAGGAFVTARSAMTLHRRQTRREAYRNFLRDAESLARKLASLIPDSFDAQSLAEPPGSREALTEAGVTERSLELAMIDVELEGTDELVNVAVEVIVDAATLRGLIEVWWKRDAGTPIPDTEWHNMLFGEIARRHLKP
jgi:hypothetical protein